VYFETRLSEEREKEQDSRFQDTRRWVFTFPFPFPFIILSILRLFLSRLCLFTRQEWGGVQLKVCRRHGKFDVLMMRPFNK